MIHLDDMGQHLKKVSVLHNLSVQLAESLFIKICTHQLSVSPLDQLHNKAHDDCAICLLECLVRAKLFNKVLYCTYCFLDPRFAIRAAVKFTHLFLYTWHKLKNISWNHLFFSTLVLGLIFWLFSN